MAKPTYTPPPNEAPVLGDPQFAAKAQGFLGWFPVMGEYMQGMGEWIETMIGDVPSDNIAAFAHLNGAANKLPYFTGAGAMAMADLTTQGRSLLAQSTFGINSNGVAYGTAVTQSNADSTTNRLLKVGDFGLGQTAAMPTCANIDDMTIPAGSYRTLSGTTSGTFPDYNGGLAANSFGFLTVTRYDGNSIRQVYATVANGGTSAARTFEREGVVGSSWGSWRENYSRRNLVGIVSHDGTYPTGAVIERGANQNGNYTRWADGTQICFRTRGDAYYSSTSVATGVYRTDIMTVDYPAAFIAGSQVSSHVSMDVPLTNGLLVTGGTASNLAGWTYRFYAPQDFNNLNAGNLSMIAIGRWR